MAALSNGPVGEMAPIDVDAIARGPVRKTAPPVRPIGPKLLTHNFPIRPDLVVPLTLPAELTAADAHRIAEFVAALAFPERPATSGV